MNISHTIDKLALIAARWLVRFVMRRPHYHSGGYNDAVDDVRRALNFVLIVYHQRKSRPLGRWRRALRAFREHAR
jgi:hypothetical protein